MTASKPDFLIVGAAKCGTSSLAANLKLHPEIYMPKSEIHYFSKHPYWGDDWYLSRFDQAGKVQGEKSPSYLYFNRCHQHIARTLPQAKLIVMLRDPVRRAFSNWNMRYNDKRLIRHGLQFNSEVDKELRLKSLDFETIVDYYLAHWEELSLVSERPLDTIHRSLYIMQLKSLFKFFPPENVFLLVSDLYFRNEGKYYQQVCEFLNLKQSFQPPSFEKHMLGSYKKEIPKEPAQKLRRFFRPYNEELFQLLGYSVPQWDRDEL